MSIGNLHNLVSAAIGTINPFVTATIQHSTGAVQGSVPGASRFAKAPSYSTATAAVQVQALDWRDLKQMDGINLEGGARKIFVQGEVAGVLRGAQVGGDIVIFPPNTPGIFEGSNWLVVKIFEQWAGGGTGWASAAIVVQNGS